VPKNGYFRPKKALKGPFWPIFGVLTAVFCDFLGVFASHLGEPPPEKGPIFRVFFLNFSDFLDFSLKNH
jgi:hypothetical protein